MKKILSLTTVAVGAVLMLAVPASASDDHHDDDDYKKVTICHAAGQEGTDKYVTLTISKKAVYKDQGGHFYENGTPRAGHEDDYFGKCEDDEVTTTTAAPTTTTVEDTTTTVEVTTTTVEDTTTTVEVTTTVPQTTTPAPTAPPTTVVDTTVPTVTTVETSTPPTTTLPPKGSIPVTGGDSLLLGIGALMVLAGIAFWLFPKKASA